jgi:hypothetical protein
VKVEAGREVAKVRRAAEAMIWPPDTGRSSQARHLPDTTADLDSAGACLHDQHQLHLPLSVSLSGKLGGRSDPPSLEASIASARRSGPFPVKYSTAEWCAENYVTAAGMVCSQ